MRTLNKLNFKLILGLCFIFAIGLTFNSLATNTVKEKMPVLTLEEAETIYNNYAKAWQNQDYDSISKYCVDVTGEDSITHHKRLYSEGIYLLSAKVNSLEKITVNELNKRIEKKLNNEEWTLEDIPIEQVPPEVRNTDENIPRDKMVFDEQRYQTYRTIENQIAQEGSIYVANVTFNFTNGTIVDDEQKFVFHDGQWKVYVR